jgi:hypothetical protein
MADKSPPRLWTKLDDFVEAFERARADQQDVALTDFLPESLHPWYRNVLGEVIRVDLELNWKRGKPARVEDYQHLVPQLFEDRLLLQSVLFEEYRLRRQGGEYPSPNEYHERFGIGLGLSTRAC